MRKTYLVLMLYAGLSIVASCSKDYDSPEVPNIEETADSVTANEPKDTAGNDKMPVVYMLPETRDIVLTEEQKEMVEKSNAFSFSLFKSSATAVQYKGKSLAMSPMSVLYVLGMLNDGAGGETEEQISSMFGTTVGEKERINTYCQVLMTEAPLTDPSVTFRTANIVATASDVHLSSLFKADMQQYYSAETASLDFTQPDALQYLNSWCNEKT